MTVGDPGIQYCLQLTHLRLFQCTFTPTTQGKREHCPYLISGKLIKGLWLWAKSKSQGSCSGRIFSDNTGSTSATPLTWKHLPVIEVTQSRRNLIKPHKLQALKNLCQRFLESQQPPPLSDLMGNITPWPLLRKV